MKKIFTIFVAILILIETGLIFVSVFIDFNVEDFIEETSFLEGDQAWADTLINHMNIDEKIGQLFFIELNNAKNDSLSLKDSLVIKSSIGGIKFKNTELVNQILITNKLQAQVKYPLLIGSEGSIINQDDFNYPMGSIINTAADSLFTDLYLRNFAEVMKYEGVHIDFSNNLNLIDSLNPSNGFSDNPNQLIYQSEYFRKKLHKNQVISCLNYNDSLFFNSNLKKVDSINLQKHDFELNKFFAIQQDSSVTLAIIQKKNKYNYSNFLKKYYNFNGLIFSNIPDTANAECFKLLLKSGTDVFIAKKNHEKFILELKNLLKDNIITEQELNSRIKRILMAKKWAGLDKEEFHSAELSLSKIYDQNRKYLSWQLYEKSICLVKNQKNSIPFINLLNGVQILSVGKNNFSFLQQYLNYYTYAESSEFGDPNKLQKQLSAYRNIIVAIDRPINENSTDSILLRTLNQLTKSKNIIVLNCGNPLNLKKLQFAQVILQAYDNHPFSQMISAQAITGSIPPSGKLIPKLSGFATKPSYYRMERLQYTIPEAAGFNSPKLGLIDTLISEAISLGATPGCQILAAKNGKVFYYKSFGHLSYWENKKVDNLDLYDLASITKVAATTLASMKLYENGKIRLSDSIKYYIDDTIHCTIKNHQLRDFFIHQTGLQPDMPILPYIRYRKPGLGRYDKYYSPKKDSSYTVKVAENFYLRKDYLDSIVFSLYNLKWDSTKTYQYSDINFNIIYDIIRRKIKDDYVKFLNNNIYNPLQLRSIGFLPIDRFPEQRIAPTQEDKFWRKLMVRGTPQDESAAIYGGISGNAGLFSNANDLAILFQMLLNGGTYGGKKIFNKETIEYFTKVQEKSSRGLGFAWNNGYYGHTGFTGCVVWANPETKMIFVFLSNSVHPKPANKKLKQMKIRSKVLNLILSAYKPEKLNQINDE